MAIAAGFAITLEDVSVSWSGEHVTAHYRNWGALGGGAVAIVAGVIALAGLGKVARSARALSIVITVLVLAGGGYQVARGLGVFFDAGKPPSFSEEVPAIPKAPPPMVDAAPAVDARPAYADLQKAADDLHDACHDDQSAPCVQWRAALEKACDAGAPSGCSDLAFALLDPPVGGPSDPARGRAVAKKACDLGDGAGCTNLAFAEHKGLGGPVDLAAAHRDARTACQAEDRQGCKNLAKYLDEDAGVTPDEKAAGGDDACFHGAILDGCGNAAEALLARPSRTADEDKHLRELLAHACRLAGDLACTNYAEMVAHGQGGAAHPELAAAIRAHACHIGDARACPKGQRPPWGPVAIIDGVNPLDPEKYETIPLLDAITTALAPCAALPHADDGEITLRVHVDDQGAVTYPTREVGHLAPDVAKCTVDHLPTSATGLAVPSAGLTGVAVNVLVSYGRLTK